MQRLPTGWDRAQNSPGASGTLKQHPPSLKEPVLAKKRGFCYPQNTHILGHDGPKSKKVIRKNRVDGCQEGISILSVAPGVPQREKQSKPAGSFFFSPNAIFFGTSRIGSILGHDGPKPKKVIRENRVDGCQEGTSILFVAPGVPQREKQSKPAGSFFFSPNAIFFRDIPNR
jgi:hypothetical protein